jgi:D-methionine transport system substrate-binding protein
MHWKMKKLSQVLPAFALLLALAGCHKQTSSQLRVGVTPGPGEEILHSVQADLKAQGVDMQITTFTDYIQPDLALASHDLDANLYQNGAFLQQFNRDHGTSFVEVEKVYLPLMAIYPGKTKSLADLRAGSRIALPNDPVNLGRALHLLQSAGLITLDPQAGSTATPKDVTQNAKQLVLVQLDAAQLPRSLDDVDAAVINANFALNAGLNPHNNSLYSETADSPYANGLATNAGLAQDARVQKLAAALRSAKAQQFITDQYHGALYPAN